MVDETAYVKVLKLSTSCFLMENNHHGRAKWLEVDFQTLWNVLASYPWVAGDRCEYLVVLPVLPVQASPEGVRVMVVDEAFWKHRRPIPCSLLPSPVRKLPLHQAGSQQVRKYGAGPGLIVLWAPQSAPALLRIRSYSLASIHCRLQTPKPWASSSVHLSVCTLPSPIFLVVRT